MAPETRPLPLIGGFESTYQPTFDVDVMETTGHAPRWREDLELLRACGYWRRDRLLLIVGETIRGFASDRATWLKYTLEQCEQARAANVPVAGYCWFPFIDSCDWDSSLCRNVAAIDPVGIYWLDDELQRRPSSLSAAYAMAAAGLPAAALPAYELQPPVSDWLRGWLPQMAHWDWQKPSAAEILPSGETRVGELAQSRHRRDP